MAMIKPSFLDQYKNIIHRHKRVGYMYNMDILPGL